MFYIFCSPKIANSDSLGDAGVQEMVVGKDQRASAGMLPLMPRWLSSAFGGEQVGW